MGSDSYLVGDPLLSSFTQLEPNLGSLPVDEVKRPDSQSSRAVAGAVGSVLVPLDPAGKVFSYLFYP